MQEKEWNKYLEKYKVEYQMQNEIRKKEIPTIIEVFKQFESDIYKSTAIYNLMSEVKEKIDIELRESLTNEQKEMLDRVNVCDDIMLNDFVEKAFICGFSVSNKLIEESRMMSKKKH